MKNLIKRSISIILVLSILSAFFTVTVSAVGPYTITLAGGYRSLNTLKNYGFLNEKISSVEGNTYTDENGVVYTLDKENDTITFLTDEAGQFVFPEYFFDMAGHTQSSWGTRTNSNTGAKYTGDTITVSKNTTYYACYDRIKYSVEFLPGTDGEGETQTIDSKTYYAGITLPDAIFTRSGYFQSGWATTENSDVIEYELSTTYNITDNIKFYPVWEKIIYDISCDVEEINFHPLCVGYDYYEPEEKSFLITNNSNVAVSFVVPVLTAYDVSVSATTLAVGETATVYVSPKSDLDIGTYNETLYFDFGDEEANISISVSFSVNDHLFVEYYSDENATYACDGTETAECYNNCGYTDRRVDEGSMKVYSADNNTALHLQEDYFKTVRFTAYGSGMDDEDCYIGRRFRPVAWSVADTEFYGDFSHATEPYDEDDYAVMYTHNDGDSGTYTLTIQYTEEAYDSENNVWIPTGVDDVKAFEYSIGVCENYFEYTVLADGIEIVGCTSQAGDIIVPAEIDGFPVRSIGDSSFYGCYDLKTVVIPEGVTSIGDYAFRWSYLESITIPDSVVSIGNEAFYALRVITPCGSYASVIYPESDLQIVHDWDADWTIDVAASCTENGSKSHHCSHCDEMTDVTVIDAIGHDYSTEWITDVEPTCTTEGSKSHICVNCGDKKDVTVIESNGHYFEGEVCSVCNGESEFEYIVNGGYVEITGYVGQSENVVIPSKINGMPVQRIGDYAFESYNNITSIMIPDSVKSIGYGAFYNCYYLTGVYITDLAAWCEIDFEERDSNPLAFANNLYIDGVLSTDLVIPEGVTAIKQYAFFNTSLTSVIIPDSVTSIDYYAFCECVSLTSITIPDSVTNIDGAAFCNMGYINDSSNRENDVLYIDNHLIGAKSSLSGEYTIRDGTKTIVACAFDGCDSLTSITIPDSVTSIGWSAFSNCDALTDVYITDLAAWCEIDFVDFDSNPMAYANNLYIDGVLSTDLVIPEGVTAIKQYAFYNCEYLASVTIPDSVTSIGESAFEYCFRLTSITIPDSVINIGYEAFYGCGLTSVIIGNNVTSIGYYAFFECYNLTSFTVDSTNANYSSVDGVLFNKDKTTLIQYPVAKTNTTYIIPDSVTSIGSFAFAFCKNLTSVIIPGSVKSIGNHAFYVCEGLTVITISEGVTSIGELAFAGCTSLASITIPESVTSIDSEAFTDCDNLATITIPDSVTGIYCNAFDYTAYYNDSSNWENNVLYIDNHLIDSERDLADGYEVKAGTKTIAKAALSNYDNLTSLIIPESITNINEYAFYGCDNLTNIYYRGLLSDWGNITIDEGNECLTNAAISHLCTLSDWVIDKAATCTEDGSKSQYCAVCAEQTNVTVIKATGHNYILQNTVNGHPHTETYICSHCEAVKIESPEFFDCLECNFTITAIDSHTYKLVSYIGSSNSVVVPSEYNGYMVTTIANSCFKGNTEINSVEFEEGITTIGSLTFMNCTSLQKVVIPESVTSIGTNAFYGFTGTIYCKYGSYAHEYAVANNISCVVEKDLPIVQTENTEIDYDNFIIRTSVQSADDVADILGLSESAVVVATASYMHGDIELYGTGTVITVFDGNDYVGDFTLIVEGDTNGDSVCDALDAWQVGLVSSGKAELTDAYALAADNNADDTINIIDYQAIVNKAVS